MRLPFFTNQIQRAIDAVRLLLRRSPALAVQSGVRSNVDVSGGFWTGGPRNVKRLAAAATLTIILSLAGLSVFTPRYKSEVRISIGRSESPAIRPSDSRGPYGHSDTGTLVQLLLSRDLARDIIQKNRLDQLPEFDPVYDGISMLRSTAGAWVGMSPLEATPIERILNAYYDRLRVHVARKSGEIVLEFQSRDPQLAARVADSIAESYVALGHRDGWLDGGIASRAAVASTPGSPSKFTVVAIAAAIAFALTVLAIYLFKLLPVVARRRSTTARAVTAWILLPTIAVFAAATICVNAVAPQFRSDVHILVEVPRAPLASPHDLDGSLERQDMAKQVQSLLSQDLAIRIIEKNKLDESPEFDPALVVQSKSLETSTRRHRVLQNWYERLSVYSVPDSRVLVVAFQSGDPERAAKVANAIAEDYLLTRRATREAATAHGMRESPSDERITSHAIESNSPAYPRKQPVILVATISTLILMILVVVTTNVSRFRALAAISTRSLKPRATKLLRTLRHEIGAKLGDSDLPLNRTAKWAIAAILSLVPSLLLADNWRIFLPIWFAGSVALGLLPLEHYVSWIRTRRQSTSSPPRQPVHGELLAQLRAQWLKPTTSEKHAAVVLLMLPSAFHWASFILGIVPDGAGIIATVAQCSPWIGMSVIGGYRKRRRKKQAELNERAIELTDQESEFILYLRSFSTSNRLRVRNTMPKTLDRLLVGTHWDIEYAFSHAFESTAPLVAIGSKGKGIGAAKIETEDSRWEELFRELAGKAKAILVVPSTTPGTRHEISTIAKTDDLLRKTIWVMPPSYWGIRSLVQRFLVRSHKKNWEAARTELGETIELPPYRRSGALVYAGFNGKECKQFQADDLAEDRLRPLVDAVIAASTVDDQARSVAIDAFALPARPGRHRVEEWLFRRWIAGLGSSINFDRLIVSAVILPAFFFVVIALSALTGFVPIGPVTGAKQLPALLPGDQVVAMMKSLPNRGDVIVLKLRGTDPSKIAGFGTARLIGLPGDLIKVEHGTLYINKTSVVQQPANDVYEGELAELRGECLAENNILPEGAEFKTLTCGTGLRDDAAKVKAAQNVAEFVVPPDKLCIASDLRGRQFVGLVNRSDFGGKAAFIAFSVKQTHENIFARIRWNRFLKGI